MNGLAEKIILPAGHYYKRLGQQEKLFLLFSVLIFGSILLSFAFESMYLLFLPLAGLFAFVALVDLKLIFWLLWASIPLSTEFYLPGGFGTDLPSEPLAIFLLLAGFLWILPRIKSLKFSHFLHPVTLLLFLHFGWICITAIQSDHTLVSLKYALAKSWYIGAYFLVPFIFIKSGKDLKKWITVIAVPLTLTIVWVMARHSAQSFSFASINSVLSPFFRNHVSYACTIVIFLPFIWYRFVTAGKRKNKLAWLSLIGLFLIATYFSYTRAAYVTIPLMFLYSFAVKWKLTRWLIAGSLIAALVFIYSMAEQNKYLEFAPDYDRTIVHKQFDDLISATYNMEDISTMERFYRWIAGAYMLREAPITGFGPGNFYNFYHSYTDRNFVTYVSDNPEKSGTHNYYLMVAVEQGIPGVLIFIILISTMLIRGERIYHQSMNRSRKNFVMACLLSLVSILFILLLNDMIETDKVGALFFFIAAMLVAVELNWITFQPDRGVKTRLSDSKDNFSAQF